MTTPVKIRIPKEVSIEREMLRDLTKRNTGRSIAQSVTNLATYGFLCWIGIIVGKWWLWPLIWWFQAIILSGFLGASHDCAHSTFVKSSRGNHVIGVCWSSIVLFNFSLYKYFHLAHHTHTNVEGDTEPSGNFTSVGNYLSNLPTTAFFVSFWKMSIQSMKNTFPSFVRSPQARRAVQLDNVGLLLWFLVIIGLTVRWPVQTLLFYWCPMLLYFPMIFWTSLPEHYGCDEGSNPLTNTPSTRSNFLYRWYCWNGNFHAEHHIYPGVPSFNLPRLHRLIGSQFKYNESSYWRFHIDVIRDLLTKTEAERVRPLDPAKRVIFEYYSSRTDDDT